MSSADEPKLLYQNSVKITKAVIERAPVRIQPKSRTSGPSQTIDFEWQYDQFVDLSTAVLHFTLSFTDAATGAADTGARIANSADCIKHIDIYYNDTNVERIMDANVWMNTFLSYTATRDWAASEGNALLGLYNQGTPIAAAANGPRSYAVPLSFISGFFRMKPYLPMVGNKLRIQIETETAAQFISAQTTAIGSYALADISLMVDGIICEPAYKRAVQTAMASDKGIRIPYSSFQTAHASITAANEQYFKITNTTSNALSLHILHEPVKTYESTKYTLYKQSFPMPLFSGLRVTSGTKTFTPLNGIRTFPELYCSALKCCNGPSDLSGQGWISYTDFIATYTPATAISGGAYGNCLMSVNLEKSLQNDDSIHNSGLNSHQDGATNDFDVQVSSSSNLAAASTFLTCLVHRRNLVFRQSACTMEV